MKKSLMALAVGVGFLGIALPMDAGGVAASTSVRERPRTDVVATVMVALDSGIAGEFVAGRAHRMRLRPILQQLRPAQETTRLNRSRRAAAREAVTSCDAARVRALRGVPSTPRVEDAPDACVVLGDGGSGSAEARFLLGPAVFTGGDLVSVSTYQRRGDRPSLELVLSETGSVAFDSFAAGDTTRRATTTRSGSAPATSTTSTTVAVTLDGRVWATSRVMNVAGPLGAGNGLSITLKKGTTLRTTRELAAGVRASRVEELVGFANEATMTRHARTALGTSNPRLDDKTQFRTDCEVPDSTDTLVLGCYSPLRLSVLRVDRPELSSVMMTTTAHEMLHAAYQQLTRRERARVDRLTTSFYGTLDDPELRETINGYPPDAQSDELHSFLPTQVRVLNPELERYYRRYFKNRIKIVEAFETFNVHFAYLRARMTAMSNDLDATQAQLDTLGATLDAAGARADSLTGQIESLRNQGRIAESNDLVPAQNSAVDEANSLLGQYNALADHFNAVLADYNTLAAEELGLLNAVSAVPITPAAE